MAEALRDYGNYIKYAKDDKNDADLLTAKRRYTEISRAAPDVE